MRLIKYIALFLCLTLVFSCTKPDEDSPNGIVPASVTDDAFRDFEQNILPDEGESSEPAFINDDGDDESGPEGTKNPR